MLWKIWWVQLTYTNPVLQDCFSYSGTKPTKRDEKNVVGLFLSEQILTSQLMIIMELGGAVER